MTDQTITVLVCGGTSETGSWDTRTDVPGMLADSAKRLDSRFRAQWVPYPAVYGTSMPYDESVRLGAGALLSQIDQLIGAPFVLWGYSQGCDVVRQALALLEPGADCLGVGMLADPGRHPDQWAGMARKPEGYGIRGAFRIDNSRFPVWSLSAQGDPISSLPAGNPLRLIADLTDMMGLAGPAQRLAWFADMVAKITAGQLQPWWTADHWRDWGGALAFARGYVIDGRHTCYAHEIVPGLLSTYTARLAQLTNTLSV